MVLREGRFELRNDLAISYMNRGLVLSSICRMEEGLADYVRCIGLEEELVRGEGRGELAGQLAWGYAQHADLLPCTGRREEACRQARQAAAILQGEVARTGRADLQRVLDNAERVAREACEQSAGPTASDARGW